MTDRLNSANNFGPATLRSGAEGDENTWLRVVLPIGEFSSESDDASEAIYKCLQKTKDSLRELGWPHEIVLLTTPTSHALVAEKFSNQVDEIASGDLAAACLQPTTEYASRVTVVDLDAHLGTAHWKWLLETRDVDVVCCVQATFTKSKWYARLAATIATLITRITLRTSKNQCRPGMVVFNTEKIRPLLDEGVVFESAEELVSFCRADGQIIFQTELSDPLAPLAQTVTLRKVAAAISQNLRFWWNNFAFPTASEADQAILFDGANAVSTRTKWVARFVFAAIATVVLFTNLGYPLFEPDEARNAQLALNIHNSGEWMSLTLFDEEYWDKPPLQAWMTAACYQWFGPNEFATRLPCAVASLLSLFTVMFLGEKLFGFRTGFLGAILLLLCTGFSIVGRYVTMDASLTFLSTLMLFATLLGVRNGLISRVWMAVAGIACGLGLLIKGPIIMVLVLPPILIVGWLERKDFFRQPRFWLYAGIPAFLIAAPWFLATAIVHPDFLVYFFWKHNVVRFTSGFNHEHPFWFYLPIIVLMMFPASFLLPEFVRQIYAQTRGERRTRGPAFGSLFLYSAWIIGFFSLSGSKLPTYILPAVPVLCLLLGRMLEASVFGSRTGVHQADWENKVLSRVAWSSLILFVIVAGVLIFALDKSDGTFVATVIATTAISVCLCLIASRRVANVKKSWGAAAVVSVALIVLVIGQLLPRISESRSIYDSITQVAEQTRYFGDSPIVFIGRPPYGYSFYIPDKQIFHFREDCELDAIAHLLRNRRSIVVASTTDIERLRDCADNAVVFQKEEAHRKLYTARAKIPSWGNASSRIWSSGTRMTKRSQTIH